MTYKIDWDEFPVIDGFDCVEYVRNVRTKHYKERCGLPCNEENEYLENASRNVDEQWTAWEKKKELVCA